MTGPTSASREDWKGWSDFSKAFMKLLTYVPAQADK